MKWTKRFGVSRRKWVITAALFLVVVSTISAAIYHSVSAATSWTITTSTRVRDDHPKDANGNTVDNTSGPYVNSVTVQVGDVISWQGKVKVSATTSKAVSYYFKNLDNNGNAWGSPSTSAPVDASGTLPKDTTASTITFHSSTYTVTTADVGKQLCRAVWAAPKSSSSSDTEKSQVSPPGCVYVGMAWGPDPNWFSGPEVARYVLENDSNVNTPSTLIPVYIKSPSAADALTGSIEVGMHGVNPGIHSSPSGAYFSFYKMNDSGTQGASCGSTAGPYTSPANMSMPASCFQYNTALGVYEAFINPHLKSGVNGEITFVLWLFADQATTHVPYIGYSSQNADTSFALANESRCEATGDAGCGVYHNYDIAFAPDCTVSQNEQATISIYDGDNVAGDGWNDIQGDTKDGGYLFTVGVYDRTNSLTSTTNIATSNDAGNLAKNKKTAHYTFYVNPNGLYDFHLSHVYANNTLQFKLPYDSANYVFGCRGYRLTPLVTLNGNTGDTVAGTGDTVDVGSKVGFAARQAQSNSTDWVLTKMVYQPGTKLTSAQKAAQPNATTNACSSFSSSGRTTCTTFLERTTQVFTSAGATMDNPFSTVGYAYGTQVCFVASVSKPTSNSTPLWGHSPMICITIGKQPKAQVIGGDLLTGGNAVGGTSTANNAMFGSWIEYGIFAVGNITGVGSGAAYAGGGLVGATSCTENPLSFALNTTSCTDSSSFGNYNSDSSLPDIADDFPVTANTPTYAGLGDTGVRTASGTVTINAGTIASGHTLVLNAPNATVNINGNITYANSYAGASFTPYTQISQIPQLVIIAKKIVIAANVTNVDAWLVAPNGEVDTCDTPPPLTVTTCNQPLTIHGPVETAQLNLWRTYSPDNATPAETIDLRPDVYLWAYNQALLGGHAQVMYSQEAAPRL